MKLEAAPGCLGDPRGMGSRTGEPMAAQLPAVSPRCRPPALPSVRRAQSGLGEAGSSSVAVLIRTETSPGEEMVRRSGPGRHFLLPVPWDGRFRVPLLP